MPAANSATIIPNPSSRHPRIAPDHAHKPKLLGYGNMKTTMIYTQILNRRPSRVRSPVDEL